MRRRLAGLFVAATVGLLLTGAEPTVAGPEALGQRVVDDGAKWPEQSASSACEREGATFVGSKPRMLREWQRPGVQPGRYVLRVSRQLIELGEVHFDVDDADVGNLIVQLGWRR